MIYFYIGTAVYLIGCLVVLVLGVANEKRNQLNGVGSGSTIPEVSGGAVLLWPAWVTIFVVIFLPVLFGEWIGEKLHERDKLKKTEVETPKATGHLVEGSYREPPTCSNCGISITLE